MAKQTYKEINVSAVKTSLAQLFLDNGLTVPTGEVTFELQNANTQSIVYVSYGDQSGLGAGHPIPPYWKTDEVESFDNVHVKAGSGLSEATIIVSVVV
jgi:hypothetical protein